MDPGLVRWLVIAAFALHGVGMIGAAAYLPFDRSGGFIGASWLLGSGLMAIIAGVVIWALAGAGYVAAAYGFWQDASWWRAAAWVGALFTLVAIVVWIGKIPAGVYVGGALAVATVVYLILY
ncbi:MAG: hypothetical protein C4521_13150 [Actinobacteria bacterium]|nr:MAG: hypothetical protein C4521_13150 [Actinomycetota bacterium]